MAASDNVIFVNTSAARTLTLPVPTNGRLLIIKDSTGNAATNNITINQHASEKIDGANSFTINQNWGEVQLQSDGTDWFTNALFTPAGGLSLAAIGSSPNANAASLVGAVLNLQPASASFGGVVTTGTQSFAGTKTFTGSISASNLSGTNTGDVTIGTANGLSLSSQVLSLALASTSTTGALSSTDWNTFNGKQSTITIGALDAQAENANGLALVSNVLSSQSADATHPGMVNITTQTFAGAKTFNNTVTVAGTGTQLLVSPTGSSDDAKISVINPSGGTGVGWINFRESSNGTATGWTVGRRTSVSSQFTIAQSNAALDGTNEYITITTGGLITLGAPSGTQNHVVNGNIAVSLMSKLDGGVSYANTRTVTTTATVGANDTVILCNQSAAFALTLPTAADGRMLIIKDFSGTAATNNITVTRAGSDVIDGATTFVININYESVTLIGSSGNWSVI